MKLSYKIQDHQDCCPVYWFEDGSFGPLNSLENFQISLNDSSTFLLNVDKRTKTVVSIEGYFPHESEKRTPSFRFNPPSIYEGELKLTEVGNELNDEGCFMPLKNQRIFYDQEKEILGIGELDGNKCLRFLDNAYVYFLGENIVGIAIKLIRR